MWDLEKIKEDVKCCLSKSRYNHSLRVMEEAKRLAKHYDADIEKCMLCGLTHDMCKEYTFEDNKNFIDKYNLSYDLLKEENKNIIHGVIASIVVKEKYNFSDDMILAIKYHTTGYPNMDLLAKIVYLADKIEPSKDYPNIEEERSLAYKDIDKAIIFCLKNQIEYLKEKNKVINKMSYDTLRFLEEASN